MFNLKQLFAYETIKVYGISDCICDLTGSDPYRIQEVCRKMGVSEATFYNWKKKYGAIGVTELRRLMNLAEENSQLKKLVAVLSLEKQIVHDVL